MRNASTSTRSGSGASASTGALHRAERRLVDVDACRSRRARPRRPPRRRRRARSRRRAARARAPAPSWSRRARGMCRRGSQHHGAAHDRTGEAAAADFVDAGDVHEPQPPMAFSSVRVAEARPMGARPGAGERRLRPGVDVTPACGRFPSCAPPCPSGRAGSTAWRGGPGPSARRRSSG